MLQHAPAAHAIQTANAVIQVANRSLNHCLGVVSSLPRAPGLQILGDRAHAAQQLSLAAIHPGAAGITQAAATTVVRFFDGFCDSPKNICLASLAEGAGEHLQEVISVNGQLVLSGMRLRKRPSKRLQESEIRSMFEELDRDGNGYIETHEMLEACKALGLPANTEYLRYACHAEHPGLCRSTGATGLQYRGQNSSALR
jgi:hypothetical protein